MLHILGTSLLLVVESVALIVALSWSWRRRNGLLIFTFFLLKSNIFKYTFRSDVCVYLIGGSLFLGIAGSLLSVSSRGGTVVLIVVGGWSWCLIGRLLGLDWGLRGRRSVASVGAGTVAGVSNTILPCAAQMVHSVGDETGMPKFRRGGDRRGGGGGFGHPRKFLLRGGGVRPGRSGSGGFRGNIGLGGGGGFTHTKLNFLHKIWYIL